MNSVKLSHVFSAIVIISLLTGCSLFPAESGFATSHVEILPQGRPICSECHERQTLKGAMKPFSAFNHTDTFVRDHRLDAARDGQVCAICHGVSFCNDCHAAKTTIKPGTMLGNRPDRELIHRGDFLTRHRIEGKVDPTGCYACHGRASNGKCASCHR